MSNLQELKNTAENPLLNKIKEIKNSGVEFKKLENLFNIRNGYTPSKKNESYWTGNTIIPWFRLEDIRENGRVLKDSIQHVTSEGVRGEAFKKDSLIISTTATIGEYALIESDFLANQQFTILMLKEEFKEKLLPKFLLHYACILSQYCKNNVNGITFKMVDMSKFRNFEIPIPPLEVQAEIVRILDPLTKNVNELIDLLKREQELRKKQYSYYRDKLLTFNEDTPKVKLGEVVEIKGRIGFRGYTRKDQRPKGEGAISLSPSNIINNNISYLDNTYISWEKYEESPEIMINEGDVIFCKTGSTLGKVALIENLPQKTTINPQLVVFKNIKCNNRFLKYVIAGKRFQDTVNKLKGVGTVPNITQEKLGSIEIPLPPLDTQKRIVDILDNFERYTNDLQKGLPAEIEKRKKQYAYYRDELLSFEKE